MNWIVVLGRGTDMSVVHGIIRIVIIALGGMLATPAGAECRLVKVGTLPLEIHDGWIVTRAEINGQETLAVIQSGASLTYVVQRTALDAGLKPTIVDGLHTVGVHGKSQIKAVTVNELKLGDFTFLKKTWFVKGDAKAEPGAYGIVLGRDILSEEDWEMDLANKRLIFWKTSRCETYPLAYWSGDSIKVRLEPSREKFIVIEAMINGKPVRAALSSATSATVLTLDAARPLGFKEDGAGVESSAGKPGSRRYLVEELGLGDVVVKSAKLSVADLAFYQDRPKTGSLLRTRDDKFPYLLLGIDFLNANRVLVANSQKLLYFTSYDKGTIFRDQVDRNSAENQFPADLGIDLLVANRVATGQTQKYRNFTSYNGDTLLQTHAPREAEVIQLSDELQEDKK